MTWSWRGLAPVVALGVGLAAAAVQAQSVTPDGVRGLRHTRSADSAGRGTLQVGGFSSLHTREDAAGDRHWFSVSDLTVGFGLSNFLEVGIAQPVRRWSVAGSDSIRPASLTGFGDLRGSVKLQLPLPWRRLRLGGLGVVSAPTGSGTRGMTSDEVDFELGGLVTIDLTDLEPFLPTRLHLNGTYRLNRNERTGVGLAPLDDIGRGGFWPPAYPPVPLGEQESWNDQLVWRGGLEFSTRVLGLATEFTVEDFPNVPGTSWRDNPVYLTQSAVLRFRNGLDLAGSVDLSLQTDDPPPELPRLPDWRFTLGLVWHVSLTLGDGDHDDVPDKRDRCPDRAEDYDGYQDEDGCPDEDNDGDGIADRDDLAPDLGEDLDGFEDRDGRPDLDNDGDGIQDVDDRCPTEAEDFDGDRDADGCPDVDGAGAPPAAAPPPADSLRTPAPAPAPAPEPRSGVIEGLAFATGSAALPPDAPARLEALLAELRAAPPATLELRGYTDDRGAAAANLGLSQRRADAVRTWLLQQGIGPERVEARGLGAADPIAPNDTAAGRAANRRIEYTLR
jgi:outer membrane protein OmpA-like peptidoglycan-associated protein